MTTIEHLREGLDILVDGAITHDMHPAEIVTELESQIQKMRDMMAEAQPGDQLSSMPRGNAP